MREMSKAEVDRAESKDFALGDGPKRPRDAATLLLLDRSGSDIRVLMGRRHRNHAFMPGKLVFPGGRTDPADGKVPVAADLDPVDEAKLVSGMGARGSAGRARALAMSAVRETYEEAGLLIGNRQPFSTDHPDWRAFQEHGVMPSVAGLRYVARAITPPGRVRRFDTRFFAAWQSDVAVTLEDGGPTDELEDLVWLSLADAKGAEVPLITKTIVSELETRLRTDPELTPGGAVPFFRMLHRRFVRELI